MAKRQAKTRAQLLREGKIKDARAGKMTPFERTKCFQFSLLISRKEEVNGEVTSSFKRERKPFVRIEVAEQTISNLGKGYLLKIEHNPKKWLTGEKNMLEYNMCERVERAVERYNAK